MGIASKDTPIELWLVWISFLDSFMDQLSVRFKRPLEFARLQRAQSAV